MGELVVRAYELGFALYTPDGTKADSYVGLITPNGTVPAVELLPRQEPRLRVLFDAFGANNGGPVVTAENIAYAAKLTSTTPWQMLDQLTRVPDFMKPWRITRRGAFPASEVSETVLGWEFFKSSGPIVASVASGPIATLSLTNTKPRITITTRATGWIAGGVQIDFSNVHALAEFAGESIPTVLAWIGSASGVGWRPSA